MTDQAGVTHLFDETTARPAILPGEQPVDHLTAQITIIQRWRRILALRWLALLALVGAVGIWILMAVDPQAWRFIGAVGYSITVLVPMLVLYHLKGD
jgi:hypothetical protein